MVWFDFDMRKWRGSVKESLVGGGLGGRKSLMSQVYIVENAENEARPDVFVVDVGHA